MQARPIMITILAPAAAIALVLGAQQLAGATVAKGPEPVTPIASVPPGGPGAPPVVPAPPKAAVLVAGRVLAAPACPVQRVGQFCPPIPVAGATVELLKGSRVVARTVSNGRGAFSLRALPGRYVLTAANPHGFPSAGSRTVTVPADGHASGLTLVLDSGIR